MFFGLRLSEDEMGQSIQEWTKETLWKTAFKKLQGDLKVFNKIYLIHS